MDGLLVIDKPTGPTSHDVVARVRRLLGERRVGHTGTLDPMATGVLPIVVGRATRLAQFLSAATKRYAAVVRLGTETDSYDATGAAGVRYDGPWPSREAIERALDAFRGTFAQQPPAFSAKKIDGQRSYHLARKRSRAAARQTSLPAPPALAAPVSVTAHAIEVVDVNGSDVTLALRCSAGFYVRSLAHDLGEQLGTGGHLLALRRTGSGNLTLDDAIELEKAEQDPAAAVARMVPLRRLLPGIPAVVLTPLGVRRAANGCELGPGDLLPGEPPAGARAGASHTTHLVRLLDAEGELVGIGHPGKDAGLLHPSIVLV